MMGKESVGGTLFFPILLRWKKRVWGTLSKFHRTEGEKECSTLFLPICTVGGNSGGYTLSPHLYGGEKECGVHYQISTIQKGKKSVVHSFSPSVRWRRTVGRNTLPKGSLTIVDLIKCSGILNGLKGDKGLNIF